MKNKVYILDELRVNRFSANWHVWVNYSFNTISDHSMEKTLFAITSSRLATAIAILSCSTAMLSAEFQTGIITTWMRRPLVIRTLPRLHNPTWKKRLGSDITLGGDADWQRVCRHVTAMRSGLQPDGAILRGPSQTDLIRSPSKQSTHALLFRIWEFIRMQHEERSM